MVDLDVAFFARCEMVYVPPSGERHTTVWNTKRQVRLSAGAIVPTASCKIHREFRMQSYQNMHRMICGH